MVYLYSTIYMIFDFEYIFWKCDSQSSFTRFSITLTFIQVNRRDEFHFRFGEDYFLCNISP